MALDHWVNFDDMSKGEKVILLLKEVGFATRKHLQSFTNWSENELNWGIKQAKSITAYYQTSKKPDRLPTIVSLPERHQKSSIYTLGPEGAKYCYLLTEDTKYDGDEKDIPIQLPPKERISSFLQANDIYTLLIEQEIPHSQIKWAGYNEASYALFTEYSQHRNLPFDEDILLDLPKPEALILLNNKYGFWLTIDDTSMSEDELIKRMQQYARILHITNDQKPLIWITNRTSKLQKLWNQAQVSTLMLIHKPKTTAFFSSQEKAVEFIKSWDIVNYDEDKDSLFYY